MADTARAESPGAATPVTLLTGFLGAGKTTLLNRLLRRPELAGTAVLINEFGEIGLDHLLVERLDEDTVLLNAGCLCCTVRDDLARALRNLLPRIEAGEVTRVVIETTGLADPAPILHTLMADPLAANAFRLDGVVTLVDAVNAPAQLDAQEEAVRQVAVADRLVLSKTDLAEPASLAALQGRLARLNPGAPQHTAVMGEIDPALLLACGLFDPARKAPDVAEWLRAEAFAAAEAHEHGDDHGEHGHGAHGHGRHRHAHDRNRHDARIRACCITRTEPLHWQGVGTWLEMLIATRGESLLRLKGILNIRGQERPVAIHGVQHLFHPPALLPAWPEGDPRTSRLVFILRDLEPRVIEEGLDAFEKAAGEV